MKFNLLIAFSITQFCSGMYAQTPVFTTYKPDIANPYSSDNQIMSIQFDKTTNLIWAGTRSYNSPLK